jgi:hypothetical protein
VVSPGSSNAAGAAGAAAQHSSDLAAIAQDLDGIDSATNQANNDLHAGDTERGKDDNG